MYIEIKGLNDNTYKTAVVKKHGQSFGFKSTLTNILRTEK